MNFKVITYEIAQTLSNKAFIELKEKFEPCLDLFLNRFDVQVGRTVIYL